MKTKRLLVSLTLGLGMTLAFLWLLTAGSMTLVHADTYTVTNTDASGPGSLRQAILDANGNPGHDTINFGITGTIVLTDALPGISDDLTITGPGAEQLAVSGANAYRVFSITSGIGVTITGVTVRDGYAADSNGGGIWSAGTLYLDSLRITDNTATGSFPFGRGGGVYVSQGSVMLREIQVVDNSATSYGGGLFIYQGNAALSGTQIVSNSAISGGGVYVYMVSATLNVSGGKIDSNLVSSTGGGMYVLYGSATLSGTQVVNNSSPAGGGGMYIGQNSATLNVSGGRIVSNSASGGGGVYISEGNATLSGTQVVSNSASDGGGGVYVYEGSVTLSETQVVRNMASYFGGGVYVSWDSGTLNVSGGMIDSNSAQWSGGGVYARGNTVLNGVQVVGNSAAEHGGGVFIAGSATLSGTQVISNSASSDGGGVYVNSGSATLSGGMIASNSASSDGGGVLVSSGSATLSRTQMVNNSASSYGGGVYVGFGNATLSRTQVDSNSASSGGGVYVRFGSATLSGTQVVNNSAYSSGGGVYVYENGATLNRTQVVSNLAYLGGGVYIRTGTVTLSGTQVVSNSAERGGGMCVSQDSATLNVNRGRIDSNLASSRGGGVYVDQGSTTLNGTQVVSNVASSSGGGVFIWSGSTTLSETRVVSNSAVDGGGVSVWNGSAMLNVGGGVIDRNLAFSRGGGVFVYYGSATLSETQMVGNSAYHGGGVYVFEGNAVLTGTQIVNNLALDGGGVNLSSSGAITATNGCIVLNSDTAVDRVDGTLTAADNWWGAVDGPGGAGPGSGDTVSAGVDYANFKTMAPAGCPLRPAPPPEITVHPLSVAFGDQDVDAGATMSQMVTITNDGTADLHVSAITSAGDTGEFSLVDSGGITLTSGSTRTIGVSFDPSSLGTKAVTLTIQSDDSDEPTIEVTLIGTGTDQEITVAPSGLAFGDQDVDVGATVSQTMTITNDGTADLHVSAITSAGDTGEFNLVDSGEITLTSGSTRTIEVSFDPSNLGPRIVTLTIQSDDGDESAVNVTLSGTGTDQEIAVAPGSLAFGDQDVDVGPTVSQTVIITNDGTADLHVSTVTSTGDTGEFNLVDSGEITLTSGSTRAIEVSFDPFSAGAKAVTLTIQSDDSDESSVNVILIGMGIDQGISVAPSSLAFGDQDVDAGATVSQTVTITNDGTADLHISAVTPTGDTDEFNMIDSGQMTLTPGNTRTLEASFDPSSVGTKVVTLTIQSDDSDEPTIDVIFAGTGIDQEITVNSLSRAFGNQDVDDGPTVLQTVAITNDGSTDLHISAIIPTGDTGEFNLVDSGEITLTLGSTRTIEVSFDPSSTGAKIVTLTIQSDDSDEPTVDVILTGAGVDQEITVAPVSLLFGDQDVDVGPTVSQMVTITNDGSADLHISSVSLTGTNADEFAVEGDTGESILTPGDMRAVQVSFDPVTTGSKSASLTIQSDDGDEAAVDVALSGTGIAADLVVAKSVTPTVVALGDTVTYTIVISNAGDVTATDVWMTDPLPSAVSFGSQSSGMALIPLPDHVYRWGPYDVAAHTAYTITFTANVTDNVDFAGQTVTNTAYVTATNVAADSDDAVFTIMDIVQAGYGSDPAPGSSINVGTTSVGSTVSTTLTISETGEATLMVTPTLSGPDAGDFDFAPATLTIPDGGAAQDLTISCTPTFTGTLARALAATLTVVHNAPGSPAVYSLSCTGEAMAYVYLPVVLKGR